MLCREVIILAERFPDETKKPVVGSVGEVVAAYPGRVAFSARSPGDDERDPAVATGGDEKGLFFDGIDCVNDHIEAGREESVGRVFGEKGEALVDDDLRIDEAHSLPERGDLETAHGSVESGELAIDIRNTDFVEIDEGDFPDPASGESFGAPGSDAAYSDHRNVGSPEFRQSRGSVEAGDAGKPVEIIRWELFVQSA